MDVLVVVGLPARNEKGPQDLKAILVSQTWVGLGPVVAYTVTIHSAPTVLKQKGCAPLSSHMGRVTPELFAWHLQRALPQSWPNFGESTSRNVQTQWHNMFDRA